jgi:hypothetical protein
MYNRWQFLLSTLMVRRSAWTAQPGGVGLGLTPPTGGGSSMSWTQGWVPIPLLRLVEDRSPCAEMLVGGRTMQARHG